MALINLATAKIIVENAMRQNRMGGEIIANGVTLDLEKAWKTVVEINGQAFEIPINYQNFRDAIAQSIVDTINATAATGTISTGPIDAPNGQVVVPSTNVNLQAPTINLNAIAPLSSPVARVGDTVTSTALSDPAFWAWVSSVSGLLNIPTPPVAVISKITTGSATVNAG